MPNTTTKGSRERDTAATRQSILDAAEDLFSAHGYADTAMSQIAKRSGVTKSLIHHHFGSKQALWEEVRARLKTEYLEAQAGTLDAAEQLPPAELLSRAIGTYFNFLRTRPHVVRMMSWSLLDLDPDYRWIDHRLNERLVEVVIAAQKNGSVHPGIDPVALLMMTSSLVEHYFESKAEFDSLLDDERRAKLDDIYLQNMLTVLQHGLLTAG